MPKVRTIIFVLIILCGALPFSAQAQIAETRTFLGKAVDLIEAFRQNTTEKFKTQVESYRSLSQTGEVTRQTEPGTNYATKESARKFAEPLYGILAVIFGALAYVFSHGILFYAIFFLLIILILRSLWRRAI